MVGAVRWFIFHATWQPDMAGEMGPTTQLDIEADRSTEEYR